MTNETPLSQEIQKVLLTGDLARLTPEERLTYYTAVCDSIGLNPLTQPLDYINLNGKLRLYAKKDATDQLRRLYDISVEELKHDFRKEMELYIVTASGHGKAGRNDVSTGAVSVGGLRGEALANAIMKAETKAKRRLTLSLCGLGMLDETEIETIAPENLLPAPAAPSVPKVDHTPATPTTDPRPGEEIPTLEEIVLDKPAGTLPKRPGRKKAEIPVTGNPEPLGITDEDIANAHKPKPEFDEEANKREAEAFAEDVCSATPVPDQIPNADEKKAVADRIRALATDGVTTAQIGTWAKKLTGKEKSSDWTNKDWADIFEELDAAASAGTLKELVKQ